MRPHEEILKAVVVTAELTGTQLSPAAQAVMVADLMDYPMPSVLAALTCCRKELSGRLTLGAIVSRLQASDGRPAADEAWAIALQACDERETVVWSTEIAAAFDIARPVLNAGDKVGARVAFREAYARLVADARAANRQVAWSASLGWCLERRAMALETARDRGYLPASYVCAQLPSPPSAKVLALMAPPTDGEGLAEVDHAGWGRRVREALDRAIQRRNQREQDEIAARRQVRENEESERRRQVAAAQGVSA